ncbi:MULTISPECIES: signal peptidase I [unclassified Bradyrhizobium]|uniref:signal peptidase I n=2 Tax=unclassified Bradyrhizobium TaxID=2631580 RepID=UPI0028EB2EB7|nr:MULTISPECIES: signal peptidase I [unclassified Bradyrhizobium]
MSDSMSVTTPEGSPFVSVWLHPRRTIARIVARLPHPLVVPLAVAGGVASAINTVLGFGTANDLFDWRALLFCLAIGGALGVINLYVLGAIAAWLVRRLGGQASAAAMRAALAFGGLPMILGGVAIVAASASAGQVSGVSMPLQILGAICGLWAMAVTAAMMAEVAGLRLWRGILTYAVAALLVPALGALAVRTFAFQPFSVPAASMMPTLLVGDNVFATKYAYGYSRYSLPFAPPLFAGRIFGAMPARGDVVVFRLPRGEGGVDYVKRVVGLPGDRVQMRDGVLHLNGQPVARERLADVAGEEACAGSSRPAKRWRETLPNGASYETIDCLDHGAFDETNPTTVPAGHLFMLGDNRDNSTDSRMSQIGAIPVENLIGRFGMIFFSGAGGVDEGPRARFERIGTMVR